ncbi:dynactin [Aspergillus bombycis]|uniref:Dynactin n=1 Tax=Aspergillus bombycis TaxID=109264 RepID=A0A1F7ZPN9_9EURO|nr:dynactin [Aspergillus bombycis]OGM41426.1 dynactin [Aspergillus bombycis]
MRCVQLYSRKCNIHDEMQKLIHQFFVKHLSLNGEDAHMLHMKYYTEYGLAIEGLARHHKIDPLQFNSEVDDALPLDTILKPDPKLRKLLEDIDRSKVRLWLLTNAYVNHGKRVVKLLGVDDQFEGITFCDYGKLPLICKPTQEMYAKAEREANVPSTAERYFVDDSGLNCKHAAARGWQTAHLVEPELPLPDAPATVRFAGTTHFAAGDWVGIELDEPTGKNDGAVQGERYFDCEFGYGMFVRPTAIAAIIGPPAREAKPAAKGTANAPQTRGRAQTGASASGLGIKKPSAIQATNTKRHSGSSASPSPAAKTASQRLGLKAGRLLGLSRHPWAPTSPICVAALPAIDIWSFEQNSKRPALRQTASKTSDEQDRESPQSDDIETADNYAEADEIENEEPTAKPPRLASGSSRAGAARPGLSQTSSPRQAQSTALSRELEELKTKLRVMEKKRTEDREKLKALETLQQERDKFEGIIQKLQAKYQPQQLEISDLRKKLRESEAQLEEIERIQAEHDSILEMATLDREMAEETADAFRHEVEALKLRVEELQLEAEVLREENEELGQTMSPEEKSSHGWLQMERTNERLREALIRLRDMTQQQESELKDQIKELQQDLEDYESIKSQYESTKEKLLVAENNVEDLKQQLETALGAEEMIEELADKNMHYQEEINELKAAIEDLEALKEINDELEYNHIETEKQMQEEIDYKESLFNEQCRKVAQQDEVIEDLEYTLARFRELVTTLQGDLEDMRASQQITEAEATDLTTRSRAMMDLNLKLQASVSKAQTKTIDIELERMDAQEAAQHLSILKLYLPEYFEGEKNGILALLRFKRVSFKATLMSSTIRERFPEQASDPAVVEDGFVAHDVLEKLLWIGSICDRFINYITNCSAESFDRIKATLFEMEPVERTMNFWIESVHRTTIPSGGSPPTNFIRDIRDELCMRSSLTQSYIDHAASSISRLRTLLQSKLSAPEGEEQEINFLISKMETLVTQARGLKVAMGKIHKALEDLRSRSLALSQDIAGPFKKTEEAAKDLSELARHLGENIALIVSDESRTEPLALEEAMKSMSQVSTLYAQPSESGSECSDTMSFIANRLRSLGGNLEELDSISTDLSITSEFERLPSPWIARASELKSNKAVSPDADEEIRRLKNEIHEASTALGVKDKTIEEQSLKVELVNSRMQEASKKASMVKELETKIEAMRTKETDLEHVVEKQRKDLQALETEREEIKVRLDRVKRASGTTGITTTEGVVVDNALSLATMRENEALRAEVESLQAAVRFLREENRRANMLDPYSVQRSAEMYSWLDVPLTQANGNAQREKIQQTASESRDVFTHLLKLTKESNICDLKSTVSQENGNRASWRPSKTKLRYQVLQQRENFEHWTEWRDDIVNQEREQDRLVNTKKERLARDRARRHAPKNSVFGGFPQGLGHGMMGHAWEILGMQQDHRKLADRPVEPSITPSF